MPEGGNDTIPAENSPFNVNQMSPFQRSTMKTSPNAFVKADKEDAALKERNKKCPL